MARDGYRFINDETLPSPTTASSPARSPSRCGSRRRSGATGRCAATTERSTTTSGATYVNYLGWFDGNPATLYTHPPEEAAKRYVEFMGGAAAALDKARGAFELGDYRWVAEVVNHVVFADPDNKDARELQAQALEQLGYQSECRPVAQLLPHRRQELRRGAPQLPTPNTSSPDTVHAGSSTDLFLDFLGMRLNGSKAGDRRIPLVLTMPDVGEAWTLMVRNGALSPSRGRRRGGRDGHDRP